VSYRGKKERSEEESIKNGSEVRREVVQGCRTLN